MFSLNPKGADREQYMTDFGLEVINMQDVRCPFPIVKKPGDFWMDLPLALHQPERIALLPGCWGK